MKTKKKAYQMPGGRIRRMQKYALCFLLLFAFFSGGCGSGQAGDAGAQSFPRETEEAASDIAQENDAQEQETEASQEGSTEEQEIPAFSGEPYVVQNDNIPEFEDWDTTEAFESYSELDGLGRCQVAYANICQELMPTEERGEIGMIKPTGWHTVKYDFIDGNYLYNRCHLIGYQLAGENANERNLITGTRYMNVEGMLPFENAVADYVSETNHHVLYRVTPVYEGDNLVADGVKMEAWSVEDHGEGICFCVFVYNCQPGVVIDYATGDSYAETEYTSTEYNSTELYSVEYILNTNTHKFHLPDCSSVEDIKPQNKATYTGSREELIEQGYDPCGRCNP